MFFFLKVKIKSDKILKILNGSKMMNGAECNICGDCTHDEYQCPNKLKPTFFEWVFF